MGLLDRWSKKKDEEKLKELDKKPSATPSSVKIVKKEKKEKAVKDGAVAPKFTGKAGDISYRILRKPLVTEKSAVTESLGKYSFIVDRRATKSQIKRAVASAYGVTPVSVNVMNVDGRRVRFGQRHGRRSDYRKAIVSLPKGQSISIHEGV